MALAGAVTRTLEAPSTETVRLFIRWFWLNACVTDDNRIQVARTIVAAPDTCTVKLCPYDTSVGASVISGLGATVPSGRNRYGGVKISAERSSARPGAAGWPLPAERMRPSGRRMALE